jgi:phage shock protein B
VLRLDPILIPLVAIICVFVVTPWMAFRHEERKRAMRAKEGMSQEDATFFHGALERLERRMKTLEAILDDEAPGWRKRHDMGED